MTTDSLTQICTLLGEWEELSLSEAKAIGNQQWEQLRAHQASKEQLMTRLDQAMEISGLSKDRITRIFARTIKTLTDVEQSNATAIKEAMSTVKGQMDRLDRSDRSLHKLRSSYTTSSAEEAWSNYS